ncbi:hypothetical protein [Actinacidiphila acidipaludis]|uniref:Uncharacterized protein n=1 Tax=Actinacidiphila acidipaludis TaxID=2873382 RepID=A0ABS7Q9D2_9ACTN|nr:hypothetical protein [Streptomyces acidipaludis]MBY8879741.1 hypothetical protein [Streptomyces acidipaludis]
MAVNVSLSRAMVHPETPEDEAPPEDKYMDTDGGVTVYEILPGGALAVLESREQRWTTIQTYDPGAWLMATGKRRGDDY